MTPDRKTAQFEQQRSLLTSVAYQILGELTAAEDVVQDAWFRWNADKTENIKSPVAWLRTTTARIALDHLKSARVKRETYIGPWLPEPVIEDPSLTPDTRYELARECELAMLHALERLNPEERCALILRKVFDCDYSDISTALDKSETACRKLVSRAGKRIQHPFKAVRSDATAITEMMQRFSLACRTNDLNEVISLLAPEVTALSDGGGKVRAALRPLQGPQEVAQVLLSIVNKNPTNTKVIPITINALPGYITLGYDDKRTVFTVRLNEDGLINWIYMQRNPDKLN